MVRNYLVFGSIVFVLIAYPLIITKLASAIQPKRLRLAEIGNELVLDPNLDQKYKLIVKAMLRDAFDNKEAVRMALGFPLFAFKMASGRINNQINPEIQVNQKFKEFSMLYAASVGAANPVFTFLLCVELVIVGIPLALLKMPRENRANEDFARANSAKIKNTKAKARFWRLITELEVDRRQGSSLTA